jgi:hypothetical protein
MIHGESIQVIVTILYLNYHLTLTCVFIFRIHGIAVDEYTETDEVDTINEGSSTYNELHGLETKLIHAAKVLEEDDDEDDDYGEVELQVKKVLDFGDDNDNGIEGDNLADEKSSDFKKIESSQVLYNSKECNSDWIDQEQDQDQDQEETAESQSKDIDLTSNHESSTTPSSSTPHTPTSGSRKGRPPPIIVSPYQEHSYTHTLPSTKTTPYRGHLSSAAKQSPRKRYCTAFHLKYPFALSVFTLTIISTVRSPGQVSPFSSAISSKQASPRNTSSPSLLSSSIVATVDCSNPISLG